MRMLVAGAIVVSSLGGGPAAAEADPACAGGMLNAVTDAGAKGDGQSDDTASVQNAITTAYASGRCVYLPRGVYRITGGLDWSRPASIVGDPGAPAILRSPANAALADTVYANRWDRTPVLDNVVFDGLRVDVNGPYKSGPVIRRSVFVNRLGEGETPAGGDQQTTTPAQVAVALTNVRGAQVLDSVFLSDRRVDGGAPLFTYRTQDLTVSGNILGADLSSLSWLSAWAGRGSWSQDPAARLTEVRARTGLPAALGHLQRGISLKLDVNATVSGNVVNRDPRSQAKSDHAVYAWGFSGLRVTGNWTRGWPQDARGGLKVRNGTGATIAGNLLNGTAVLLYTYDVTNAPKVFQDVVVCGNVYDIRGHTPAADHSGIMYWRNFPGTGAELAIAVFGNRFLDPRAGAAGRPDISQVAGDAAAFTASGNTYADGRAVPVSGMREAAPTAAQRARCAGATVPALSIPGYQG
ncbi:Pectate lyase superfamily protein [Nonomuraea solani]|uniref:Pectate lyase superfamily protein n=1 Tax=Nonomuraea solani TaxID=1144553 RepID=A0A1H6F0J9_9ACTN|nr:glycosyl hydrolase family 28-related protein [Nonomuraea solani]SEH02635.1 Pectate lyase superfamily protein [Nonomuraea solani]